MDGSRSSMSTHDLDGALAQAARQVELARQEHLYLQQEHERLRLRQRLAREREREQSDREDQREVARLTQGGRQTQQSHTTDSPASSSQQRDHPVYLLNCKGCGSFLSDRGMKAILLLKPHVTLYSTDIMPSNVGPLYPASQRTADRSLTRSPSSSGLPSERQVERTCDCLTETLGCYGCGAQIGYHIIAPCTRCTASVTDQKKGSNGHRTVLHCSEITARERRYVPGESGVRCAPTPCPFPQAAHKERKLPSSLAHRVPSNTLSNTLHWGRGSPLSRDNTPLDRYARPARRNVRLVHIDRSGPIQVHRRRANGGRIDEHDDDDDLSEEDDFLDLDDFAAPEEDEMDTDMAVDLYDELEQDKFDIGGGRARALSAASLVREQRRQAAAAAAAAAAAKSRSSGAPPARLLERGAIVYWGDLVPGGERCRPFDSDLALQVPVAVR